MLLVVVFLHNKLAAHPQRCSTTDMSYLSLIVAIHSKGQIPPASPSKRPHEMQIRKKKLYDKFNSNFSAINRIFLSVNFWLMARNPCWPVASDWSVLMYGSRAVCWLAGFDDWAAVFAGWKVQGDLNLLLTFFKLFLFCEEFYRVDWCNSRVCVLFIALK